MGDGGEQDPAGGGGAVEFLVLVLVQHAVEVLLELVQAGVAGVGLVVAEEGEDGVGLAQFQVGFGGREPAVARAVGHLVAAETEVAKHDVLVGDLALQHGLEPAVVLEAVGQGVADQADPLPFLEFMPGGKGGQAGKERGEGGTQGKTLDHE